MSDLPLILVTEDDQIVRDLTIDSLDALGYCAIGAASAEGALELLKKHTSLILLMTDFVLPDRDGVELALQAQALRPQISILIASGYVQNQQLISKNGQIFPSSFSLISKPFTLEQLQQKLAQMLSQKSCAGAAHGAKEHS